MFSFLPKWRDDETALGFVPEWLAVAGLCLLDILLLPRSGIHFAITGHDGYFLIPILFVIALTTRKLGGRRTGFIVEFLALMLAAATVLAVLTYMGTALSAPLMDRQFQSADRALGFDWLAWFDFVTSRPALAAVMKFAYFGLGYEALYFALLMGMMDETARPREIFWLLLIACVITCIGGWAAPALGPFATYGLQQSYGAFVPEIEHLRSGHDMTFALGQLQGVVAFPSFHTTMALGMAYAFRKTGVIGWLIAAINLVVLLAVPVFGGHYLVDMIAGACVFVLALAVVRWAPLPRAITFAQMATAD
jgi:hypothetical protein